MLFMKCMMMVTETGDVNMVAVPEAISSLTVN